MVLTVPENDLDRLPTSADPEIASGASAFRRTRVPADVLVSNLAAGSPWTSSTRGQTIAALEL